MNTRTNILNTKNLDIGYKSSKSTILIAQHLNLTLKQGQFTALIGQNGIGKSTLLKTLTQVIPAINGEVLLNNSAIQSIPSQLLAKMVAVVFTEKIPNSHLTVYELIALGRQPYTNWLGKLTEEDIRIIDQSIEYVQLEKLKSSYCDELSDGQLQRVMIARALAQDTPLIILDEPTAHLDLLHKFETFSLLQSLAKNFNKAVLISTHELQLALQMTDDMWLMNKKGIIQNHPKELIKSGEIDDIFESDKIYFDQEKSQFLVK